MLSHYIALDIGNVCLELDFERTFDYFGFSGKTISDLPAGLLHVFEALNRGKASQADLIYAIRVHCEKDLTDAEIVHGFKTMIVGEVPGISELIHEGIEMGYRFAFFSDTSAMHFYECVSRLSFAHLIDGRIVSYEVGAEKPDRAMFDSFERYYGTPLFYFDDRKENIIAARDIHGWRAHQFTNAESALTALREYHAASLI